MRAVLFCFLILVSYALAKESSFMPILEKSLEEKFTEYTGYLANWLQSFNDKHLGKSVMGRFLHYDEMKRMLVETKNPSEGRTGKKAGIAMMPLIFHIGATSTWMMLTTLLTAKSLAVGLLLLVFKIAVSSAKLASFFTHLKLSKQPSHHHDWTPSWTPHYEHHDNHIEHHPEHHGTITHTPEWTPHDIPHHHIHEYKNEFHDFKNNEIHDFKNTDFHNFNTHDFNDHKTVPTHDYLSRWKSSMVSTIIDGYFNNYPGAKKKPINTTIEPWPRTHR